MAILWGVPPPPRLPRAWIRLIAPESGKRLLVARIGPLVGVMTHWVKPRTMVCTGAGSCPHHHEPQTWKGFSACVVQSGVVTNGRGTWREAVAVISEGIAEEWQALSLGCPVYLKRVPGKNNGALALDPAKLAKIEPLPDPFNVVPYVCRAMGWPEDFSGGLRIAK